VLLALQLEEMLALAVLMTLVASMKGNAGTQSLTVTFRALFKRELTTSNASEFVIKETTVSFFSGVAFAFIMSILSWLYFGGVQITAVLTTAMIIKLKITGLLGALILISLERLNFDPAIGSSVFITTVTDIAGFFSFLGPVAYFLI
jgi:magnesium transporter